MSRPSSPMQVATRVLKAPDLKSVSTFFCSACFMPTPFAFPEACPMKILQRGNRLSAATQGQQQNAVHVSYKMARLRRNCSHHAHFQQPCTVFCHYINDKELTYRMTVHLPYNSNTFLCPTLCCCYRGSKQIVLHCLGVQ